jgi:acetate kinase
MVAATESLDALVFSGGVGEHAPQIRRAAAVGLRFLEVTIDDTINTAASPDCEITCNGSVRVLVIAAREEVEIAQAVRAALPEI